MPSDQASTSPNVRRRTVLLGTAAGAGALTAGLGPLVGAGTAEAATASGRTVYNPNYDRKFVRSDVSGAQVTSFNDTSWTTVSVPHTFNDVDSYDEWITSSGEAHVDRRIVWYRKHFTVPADQAGKKVFFECEGIQLRQLRREGHRHRLPV